MRGYRVVWPEAGRAEIESFQVPPMKSDSVLIRMEYSVISAGTEMAWLRGERNTSGRFPQYPGYSGSGRIVEAGKDITHLKLGDKVLADHVGHASHAVVRGNAVVPYHSDIRAEEAAFMVIASMSLQGVRKARLELGESAMVMGLGLLGLFAVQLVALDGALPVIAVDFSDDRRRLASELGADYVLSPESPASLYTSVRQLTQGAGADAVIEVTGASAAMEQALECCAHFGRVIALGCSREPADGIDFYRLVHQKGVSIIGAHNHVRPLSDSTPHYWTTRDDLVVLLRLLHAGRLRVGPMISELVPFCRASEFYGELLRTPRQTLGNVFDWRES